MSDLISRQDAIDAIDAIELDEIGIYREYNTAFNDGLHSAIFTLEDMPSAERVGKWIQISPAKIYECSVCGQNVMTDDIDCYKYCHGCGARMVSEDGNN